MAEVILEIGGFRYPLSCREGEEEHFRSIGAVVEEKVQEARKAVGSVSEIRQLLFASLLLADALNEANVRAAQAEARIPEPSQSPSLDPIALEELADRMELVATQLENRAGNA